MPTLTCPHCLARSHFTEKARWLGQSHPGDLASRGIPFQVLYGAWTCDGCQMPIVGAQREYSDDLDWYYPTTLTRPDYPDVPEDVAQDAREAHQCLSVGAWRAAVVMARRALQSTAYDKGAPGDRLLDQIDWLEEERVISPQMKGVAHRIRLSGNVGAHPDQDGLADIHEKEPRAVVGFLDDFLRYVYEIPARLAAMEAENDPNRQEELS